MYEKFKILVAPLDWGLGHTTRCIPVIKELMKQGAAVITAGTDAQKAVLKAEFPGISSLHLDGYNVKYSSTRQGLSVKMLQQMPGIYTSIKKEHAWLKQVIAGYNINGVISDNRFGLFTDIVPAVFITHQLHIKSSLSGLIDGVVQKLNYRKIEKYSACWIPDFEKGATLAGVLSHPSKPPAIPCHYIGPLSRNAIQDPGMVKGHLLFIISGPEPQRTIWEEKVFAQAHGYKGTVTIVRGLPGNDGVQVLKNGKVYNHLPAAEMNGEMSKAAYIICRSGYSSVMDINAIKKKAILIPTPGQPEQEYLAAHLMKNNFAVSCSQEAFDLSGMLKKAAAFSYNGFINPENDLLSAAVHKFLQDCEKQGTRNPVK
ncbi:MAG: glycosyltransferase [Niabella sp.]